MAAVLANITGIDGGICACVFYVRYTGQMFRQFALCIASSIGLSTLVALTLAPALCAMILKSGEEKADFEFIQKFDDWFNGIRDKYLEGVNIFINSHVITIILFVVILLFISIMFYMFQKAFCHGR